MLFKVRSGKVAVVGAAAIAIVMTVSSCSGGGNTDAGGDGDAAPAKLSILVGSAETELAMAESLIAGFEADNPDITIETETRPAGADGDNLVKTKLATGEMNDLFFYNAGASANAALSSDKYLLDLSDQEFMSNVNETFLQSTRLDGAEYAVPIGGAMGGGIFYNKATYAELSLDVPATWADFESNSEAIKAAGLVPVAQTYGDTWTSQMLFAANFANVLSQEPDWADRFTANEAKFADDDVARAGMDRIQEGFEEGWLMRMRRQQPLTRVCECWPWERLRTTPCLHLPVQPSRRTSQISSRTLASLPCPRTMPPTPA